MIPSVFTLPKKHSSKFVALSVILLLTLFSLRVISEIKQKSVTIDEFVHLPAGYYYLKTGDFKLFRIHAPFIQIISAVPMLFQDINFLHNQNWKNINDWSFGYDFMFMNRENYQKIFEISRFVILGISVLLGYFVYKWTRELFGAMAGLFALFLFSFSPDILAHSGLVTLDIGVSCLIFITHYFFWKFTQSNKIVYCVISGITLGLAIISKYSALMAIPLILTMSLLVVIFRSKAFQIISVKKYLISLIMLFTICLIVINAGYLFKGSLSSIDRFNFQSNLLKPFNSNAFTGIPVPLPYHFLKGFDEQLDIQEGKFDSYLCGEVSNSSWWYYYIAAFLFKEPLSLIIVLLTALALLTGLKKLKYDLLIFVLLPQAVIFIIISMMSVNIGIRYILPVFPFMFVFAGSIVDVNLYQKYISKNFLRIIIIICSCWYLIASIKIHPHNIAYFNEMAGGPGNGYKYLIDSNIDWGQDLIELKKYLLKNKIDKITLAYFGRVDPELYGIHFDLLTNRKVKGYCAISVSYLAGRPYVIYKDKKLYYAPPHLYTWLSDYKPIAKIGYSIYFYKID